MTLKYFYNMTLNSVEHIAVDKQKLHNNDPKIDIFQDDFSAEAEQ